MRPACYRYLLTFAIFALPPTTLLFTTPFERTHPVFALASHHLVAPVGMIVRKFEDEDRKNWQDTGTRPENTLVWYPATPGSKIGPMRYGDPTQAPYFTQFQVAWDGELAAEPAQHPMLLLSHGSTALGLELMWMGYYFAERGYIVVAVDHHGNTIAEGFQNMVPQGFLFNGERALDLTVVLNKMLADPVFGPHIDRNRIFAAGHSAGGASVIGLAGARYDMAHLTAFCSSAQADVGCEPRDRIAQGLTKIRELQKTDPVVPAAAKRQNGSFLDPRIKAVFAMAPALGEAFTESSVADVRVPVEIVVGQADAVTPPPTNAARLAKLIKGAKLVVLPGNVGHATFGSTCTALGRQKYEGCRDGANVDRDAVHDQVGKMAYRFLQQVSAAP